MTIKMANVEAGEPQNAGVGVVILDIQCPVSGSVLTPNAKPTTGQLYPPVNPE